MLSLSQVRFIRAILQNIVCFEKLWKLCCFVDFGKINIICGMQNMYTWFYWFNQNSYEIFMIFHSNKLCMLMNSECKVISHVFSNAFLNVWFFFAAGWSHFSGKPTLIHENSPPGFEAYTTDGLRGVTCTLSSGLGRIMNACKGALFAVNHDINFYWIYKNRDPFSWSQLFYRNTYFLEIKFVRFFSLCSCFRCYLYGH